MTALIRSMYNNKYYFVTKHIFGQANKQFFIADNWP